MVRLCPAATLLRSPVAYYRMLPALTETLTAAYACFCASTARVLISIPLVWGASDWWDEPNMDVSYINFRVVRFEMGQGLGLQLYSVQSDVIIIRPDKTVQFKPIGGENAILINPELTFTPPAVTARRELETSTMSPKKAEAHLAAQHKKAELQRFTGSCHPFHGCPASPKTDLAAKIRARRALQPKRSPRQLEEERRQLGFFSALMTSGNFMSTRRGSRTLRRRDSSLLGTPLLLTYSLAGRVTCASSQ